MKKSRFTETQIVSILKEADAGVLVKDLCRKDGISEPTYYDWKCRYGGMEASDLKRMKELESELAQFKRMYVDRQAISGRLAGARARAGCRQGLRLRRLVPFGLLPPACGLDGAGRPDHRGPGPVGGRTAQPGFLEVPQAAPAAGPELEPQAYLPGVQTYEPAPAAPGQAPASQAGAPGAVRAQAAGYGLVRRFHD
jgi:putative transposase